MLHPRLAPALEVLHAAVAVAGDQTAKVSLVASADLVFWGFLGWGLWLLSACIGFRM